MKYQTEDENDIKWMADPSGYEVADVMQKMKDAGNWEEFLRLEQDNDGVVDCDALYDRLRHESREALKSVGLHETDATATVMDVVNAWAKANEAEGMKVSYCADGKTPSGLCLYDYGGRVGISLEFDATDEDGATESVSLDVDDVLDLVKSKSPSTVDSGAWSSADENTAVFEMWKESD